MTETKALYGEEMGLLQKVLSIFAQKQNHDGNKHFLEINLLQKVMRPQICTNILREANTFCQVEMNILQKVMNM